MVHGRWSEVICSRLMSYTREAPHELAHHQFMRDLMVIACAVSLVYGMNYMFSKKKIII